MSPTSSVRDDIQPSEFSSARESAQNGDRQRTLVPKGQPFLGKPFTVKKTVQRHATVIKILSRAGKRAARAGNDELADAYHRLQAKLTPCRPRRRCGSSACPKCARAFQRAKVEAEQTVIADLANARANKHLVFVTIIPRGMTYLPGNSPRSMSSRRTAG